MSSIYDYLDEYCEQERRTMAYTHGGGDVVGAIAVLHAVDAVYAMLKDYGIAATMDTLDSTAKELEGRPEYNNFISWLRQDVVGVNRN